MTELFGTRARGRELFISLASKQNSESRQKNTSIFKQGIKEPIAIASGLHESRRTHTRVKSCNVNLTIKSRDSAE